MAMPAGWEEVSIGQICDLVNGRAFKPTDWTATGLPIVRIQNLNKSDAKFNYYDGKIESKYLIENGDLLFAWSGTPGTSFGAHVWTGQKAVLNQHIFNIKFRRETIDTDFFKYAINQTLDEQIEKAHGGVGLRHVTKGKFEETRIPLPPLSEQRRIVAKIGKLSAKSKRARDHLEHVPTLVRKYKSAILQAAFEGKLSCDYRRNNRTVDLEQHSMTAVHEERYSAWAASKKSSREIYVPPTPLKLEEAPHPIPTGWCWAAAEEIVQPGSDIVYGIVQPGPKLDKGVPYVRGTDIENGVIKIGQLLFTSNEIAAKYSRASLEGGDVLLGIIRATKVAVVPDELRGANITQGTARLRPSQAIITNFLARWLEGDVAQRWLHSKYRGIDMPGLNLRDVRRCPVPIAPLAEQAFIVDTLNRAFSWIDRLAADLASARKLIDHLDQAVLSKAFRGELVPQDPDDEPASALLERIKAEGTGAAAPRRGRGRPRLAVT
ncbi:restriction endonuclease subunit S [Methylobacterium sp. P31]